MARRGSRSWSPRSAASTRPPSMMVGSRRVLWFVYAACVDARGRGRAARSLPPAASACSPSSPRSGGSRACGPRAATASPILRYTETYETVAKASNAPEVLRGLGYWFFYGDDKLGPWIEPSVAYTQHALAARPVVPAPGIGALLAAATVRWRNAAYFVAAARDRRAARRWAHTRTTIRRRSARCSTRFTRLDLGLALRSTPRAVPLIILALAVCWAPASRALGAVASTARARRRRQRSLSPSINLPPLWTGQMVANNLQRPEDLPEYWRRPPPISTPRATTPGCSSCRAPTSRRTGGATPSIPSPRG